MQTLCNQYKGYSVFFQYSIPRRGYIWTALKDGKIRAEEKGSFFDTDQAMENAMEAIDVLVKAGVNQ